jgi:hypothetical protein
VNIVLSFFAGLAAGYLLFSLVTKLEQKESRWYLPTVTGMVAVIGILGLSIPHYYEITPDQPGWPILAAFAGFLISGLLLIAVKEIRGEVEED